MLARLDRALDVGPHRLVATCDLDQDLDRSVVEDR